MTFSCLQYPFLFLNHQEVLGRAQGKCKLTSEGEQDPKTSGETWEVKALTSWCIISMNLVSGLDF